MLHKSLSAALGAASLAALLAASVPASAASITIQGTAFCSGINLVPNQALCAHSFSNLPDPNTGIRPEEDQASAAPGSVSATTPLGSANASATTVLNFGALGATAHVDASGVAPGTTGQLHTAEAFFTIHATDTITLTSPTLADGTAVTLRFTLSLDSLATRSGSGQSGAFVTTEIFSGDGEGNPLGLNLMITDSSDGPPAARTLVQDVIAHIGEVVDIGHDLSIGAQARVSFDVGPTAIADVIANNTAHLFIDVIGSDALITTASGTNYSSGGGTGPTPGVPAPAGVGLFLLGLAGVAALRRRRAG